MLALLGAVARVDTHGGEVAVAGDALRQREVGLFGAELSRDAQLKSRHAALRQGQRYQQLIAVMMRYAAVATDREVQLVELALQPCCRGVVVCEEM